MLSPGSPAPSFALPDAASGATVADPWHHGATVVAFFKVTCPVCQLVAPKIQALADAGLRVTAIGQDPPPKLAAYADRFGQRVQTLSEAPPYAVSNAWGISSVPTVFLVGTDGVVQDVSGAWSRDAWNRIATAAGAPGPISTDGDGLPPFRPG